MSIVPLRAVVPAALLRARIWLVWRSIPGSNGSTRPRKVPYYACGAVRRGELDSEADRDALVSFDDACAAFDAAPGRYAGLAIALGPSDIENLDGAPVNVSGIDLDNVIDEQGQYDQRALSVLMAAQSYAEVSPSGRGVKIIGLGRIGVAGKSGTGASVEIYEAARFFTVTGQRVGQVSELADLTDAAAMARQLFQVAEVPERNRPKAIPVESDPVLAEIIAAGLYLRELEPGTHSIRCPWASTHTTAEGPTTTVLFQPNFGGYRGHGFKCQHAHCAARTIDDVRNWFKVRRPTAAQEEILVTDSTQEPVRWLWTNYIARGKLHILVGAPGVSKSTVMLDLCARLSRGEAPLGIGTMVPTTSLYVSFEDDLLDTVHPRLLAAGADMKRVLRIKPKFLREVVGDRERLKSLLLAHGVSLLVLDVFDDVLELENSHQAAEVRHALQPWSDLAAELDLATFGLRHARKDAHGSAQDRQVGSIAFTGSPRIVLMAAPMVRQVEGRERREIVLFRAKSNCSGRNGGLVYETVVDTFESPKGRGEVVRVNWLREIEGSPESILAQCNPDGGTTSDNALERAKAFLSKALADGQWHMSVDVERNALAEHISLRTLTDARRELQVEPDKTGAGWRMRLRTQGGKDAG